MDKETKPNLQKKIILASASPRRKEILGMLGIDFEVIISQNELEINPEIPPETAALAVARAKAESVAAGVAAGTSAGVAVSVGAAGVAAGTSASVAPNETTYIIGSDTIVINPDGVVLGKPKDKTHAFEMLSSLQGRTHKVITAVFICGYEPSGSDSKSELWQEVESFTSSSEVTFFSMDDDEIYKYIETGEPLDKAGSYGIQGIGMRYIEKISGDFFSVMGLPASALWQKLKNRGII